MIQRIFNFVVSFVRKNYYKKLIEQIAISNNYYCTLFQLRAKLSASIGPILAKDIDKELVKSVHDIQVNNDLLNHKLFMAEWKLTKEQRMNAIRDDMLYKINILA